MFESIIPVATSLWNFVQHVHDTCAKGCETELFGKLVRCTSYKDRGEDQVKVLDVASGLYTFYCLDDGRWTQMEGQ